MATESTDFLLHVLRQAIDNLRDRMDEEANQDNSERHFHITVELVNSCRKAGCAGIDPVFATDLILRDARAKISRDFPTGCIEYK